MTQFISKLYKSSVLDHPVLMISFLVMVLFFGAYYSRDFKLDASADTLILENDADLKVLREINDRYKISKGEYGICMMRLI